MKNIKPPAFTLIELLVVIVIIGILSAIAVSSFQSFQAKARDAERELAISEISKLIIADTISNELGLRSGAGYLYIPDPSDVSQPDPNPIYGQLSTKSLLGVLNEIGYQPPAAINDICYFYNWYTSSAYNLNGDNTNAFVVATWSESRDELIASGSSPGAVNYVTNTNPLVKADFTCAAPITASSTYSTNGISGESYQFSNIYYTPRNNEFD